MFSPVPMNFGPFGFLHALWWLSGGGSSCQCMRRWFDPWLREIFVSPGGSDVKNLPTVLETWVQSLGGEDPQEKEMATHSSILA